MGNKTKYTNFEDSIEDLEQIVKKLEEGNLTLDESLEEFQKGIEAYKYCNTLLNQAEGKVKLIVKNENNEIQVSDFKDLEE